MSEEFILNTRAEDVINEAIVVAEDWLTIFLLYLS